ncbi:hypothetical protein F5148DRAFT_1290485 [Russula earlei]|uniref:Uncharacterized protein n=1 Tax=Russula earlei TaxID=71964 RepID=A0ACC0TVM1_9AGAM|nr:hypothetical protein F5148DRAFT_1290485 [Russula earlei]
MVITTSAQTAQSDIYVPKGGSVFFYAADTASIFGNVWLDGMMGNQTGSRINFFGRQWHTGSTATLPDESPSGVANTGGLINFQQPSPLYGNLGRQLINGNYDIFSSSGSSYPSILLNNSLGLQLDSTSLLIRRSLQLTTGKVYLDNNNLLVGGAGIQGIIKGYNQYNYVVTGDQPMGGFLYLYGIQDSIAKVVFPIGTTDISYTPMAIKNRGKGNLFRARVFDKVFDMGMTGKDISVRSVNKTWILASADSNLYADVELQHTLVEEGNEFITYRRTTFISRFTNGAWDTAAPYALPRQPGDLTTGPAIYLYTKFSKSLDLPHFFANVFNFTAQRLLPVLAKLDWSYTQEQVSGVTYYEVEKRLEPDSVWKTVNSVPYTAANAHRYTWYDNDVYYRTPISYRIKAYTTFGAYFYSDIRTIPGVIDPYYMIYPNPTNGAFDGTKDNHFPDPV